MGRKATKHRAVPAKESKPRDVGELATELAGLVALEVDRLTSAEGTKLTPTQRGNQIKRCAAMLRELRRLSGDELTEREVLRAPAMRRIVERVLDALEKFPEALAEVAKAFEARGETAT